MSIAKTTAIASGTKSDFAAPVMKTTGTKTMQMQSVETNAGVAISRRAVEDRADDRLLLRHVAVDVLDLDRRVVDEDADGERHAAERHDVERLARAHARTMIETRIESGIETTTMSVLRQLPRKRRSMSAVSPAAMAASFTTPSTAARTKTDWSKSERDLELLRQARRASSAASSRMRCDDVERARAALLEDRHEHGLLALDVDDVRLRGVAVAHVGDVAHVDRRAAHDLDRDAPRSRSSELGARVEDDRVLVRRRSSPCPSGG